MDRLEATRPLRSEDIRGFSKHVGHALTFKILTDDTKKIHQDCECNLARDGENNLKLV
jgi:hypothetical protein